MVELILLKDGTLSYARKHAEIDQEKWLKDVVRVAYVDTWYCTPSLVTL